MNATEVEQIVLAQIGDEWNRWTSHGLDLRRSVLRPPRLETYTSHTPDGDVPVELWLVVEEKPDTHDGYEIFYDEEEQTFGLGTLDRDGNRHDIGRYGSLWDTLEGM